LYSSLPYWWLIISHVAYYYVEYISQACVLFIVVFVLHVTYVADPRCAYVTLVILLMIWIIIM
jgi:hypothetical protein